MLSLMDPVEIDSLVLYRDDDDPRKFYLLPDQPQIPLDEQGIPEFLLIHYIKDQSTVGNSEGGAGGYLQLRTSLAVSKERRDQVCSALASRLQQEKSAGKKPFGKTITSTEPLLASPLWVSGEAQLQTFGVRDSGLVVHAVTSALPDLGGDLAASFALELSNDGAEIFWSAFNDPGRQLPMMVSYKLTYKAGISASMTISASHTKVRERLWTKARAYSFVKQPFPRYVAHPHAAPLTPALLKELKRTQPSAVAMVTKQQLHEAVRSEITVNITSDMGTGPEAEKSREQLTQMAADIVSERLIPLLFGSDETVPAADREEDTHAAGALHRLPEDPLGTSETTFSMTVNQSATIERSVNPNGSIRVLIPEEHQQVNHSCFRELRLSDGFFSLMRVRARLIGVDLQRDGIAAVHVKFVYDQVDDVQEGQPHVRRSYDKLLRSSEDATDWLFDLARSQSGGHKREYQYQTTVYYAVSIPATTTPWMTCSLRELGITPQSLCALRVELVYTARKEWLDGARVHLHHRSLSGQTYDADIDLTADAPKKNWFQYTGDVSSGEAALTSPQYEFQVTYRTPAGEIRMPVQRSVARTLEIGSPFAKVIRYTLVPQGFTEGVSSVSGELIYEDSLNDYRWVKNFALDRPTASAAIDVPILEGGPEDVRLVARVHYENGTALTLPTTRGRAGTNMVGMQTVDFLSVDIVPLPDLDFDKDLTLVMVTLVHDEAGHATQPKVLLFKKGQLTVQTWKVPLSDPQRRRYSYTVQFIAQDRSKSTTVKRTDVEDPVILLDRQASFAEPPGH